MLHKKTLLPERIQPWSRHQEIDILLLSAAWLFASHINSPNTCLCCLSPHHHFPVQAVVCRQTTPQTDFTADSPNQAAKIRALAYSVLNTALALSFASPGFHNVILKIWRPEQNLWFRFCSHCFFWKDEIYWRTMLSLLATLAHSDLLLEPPSRFRLMALGMQALIAEIWPVFVTQSFSVLHLTFPCCAFFSPFPPSPQQ